MKIDGFDCCSRAAPIVPLPRAAFFWEKISIDNGEHNGIHGM